MFEACDRQTRFLPQGVFFTKGVGVHRAKLQSFEMALRKAGVATCNLVSVSSIFPPHCRILTRKKGLRCLRPGALTFAVMARAETAEPNRLVGAAIGLAVPRQKEQYGYLSELHDYGLTGRKMADEAEDLAATMLATTMGIEFDPEVAWDERKQIYRVNKTCQFTSRSVCQTAEGNKDGLWTTVLAMAVFVMDLPGATAPRVAPPAGPPPE
jgi:arginine decarboxylase